MFKILEASNGLNAIVEVVSNLALTEEIMLDAAHARSRLSAPAT